MPSRRARASCGRRVVAATGEKRRRRIFAFVAYGFLWIAECGGNEMARARVRTRRRVRVYAGGKSVCASDVTAASRVARATFTRSRASSRPTDDAARLNASCGTTSGNLQDASNARADGGASSSTKRVQSKLPTTRSRSLARRRRRQRRQRRSSAVAWRQRSRLRIFLWSSSGERASERPYAIGIALVFARSAKARSRHRLRRLRKICRRARALASYCASATTSRAAGRARAHRVNEPNSRRRRWSSTSRDIQALHNDQQNGARFTIARAQAIHIAIQVTSESQEIAKFSSPPVWRLCARANERENSRV